MGKPGAQAVRAVTHSNSTPRQFHEPTIDADVIRVAALRVLDLFEPDRPVRLLGVRLELQIPQ